MNNIIHTTIQLKSTQADGYIIPLGSFNLVFAITNKGMVGCGAFDVNSLNKFNYPAARIAPTRGSMIATIDDLLSGTVLEANAEALARGITSGMSGREALERMEY